MNYVRNDLLCINHAYWKLILLEAEMKTYITYRILTLILYHEHEWEDSINPTSSETVVLYYYVLSVRKYIVNESASRNLTP
jgi:hypothetical protein